MSADDPETDRRRRERPAARRRPRRRRELRRLATSRRILSHTRDVVFLEDGEIAVLTRKGVDLHRLRRATPVDREPQRVTVGPGDGREGRLQALHAQGDLRAAARGPRHACSAACSEETGRRLPRRDATSRREDLARHPPRRAASPAAPSWHAALVGKFMIEQLARLPVEVDYGSRVPLPRPDRRARTRSRSSITQSGETADTLAALREAKAKGARSIAICNVVGSHGDARGRRHASTRTPAPRSASPRPRRSRRSSPRSTCSRSTSAQARGTLDADERAASSSRRSTQLPRADRGGAQDARRRSRRSPKRCYQRSDFLFLGRGIQLPDRARGRAQAEGDLVHPRRGLRGRRDEARPDRADRREDAGRRDRAARRRLREDARQPRRRPRRAAA